MVDAITKVRKSEMGRSSTISEVQLRNENETLKLSWNELQLLKQKIIKEKQDSSKLIDERYADELNSLQETYAFWFKITRN